MTKNKYQIQVLVEIPKTSTKEWKSVHPTNEKPYEFNTRRKAENMSKMWYPSNLENIRIIKV